MNRIAAATSRSATKTMKRSASTGRFVRSASKAANFRSATRIDVRRATTHATGEIIATYGEALGKLANH